MPFFALFRELLNLDHLVANPIAWVTVAFQLWMLVDALRRGEWIWAAFIFFFWVVSAILYFFMVYRQEGPAGGGLTRGFELPGASDRRRIKQLEAQIHHLDKAHHHCQLADIYFQQGKLAKAEGSYRAAMERDSSDPDTLSHYGQCLLRLNRPSEAKPLLEQVLAKDPKHDFGYTAMAYAETLTALGDLDGAIASWRKVLEKNSYSRARVQLAELLARRGDTAGVREQLNEVISDDQHAPAFQRSRDKVWVKRAKATLSKLPAA